MRKNTLYSWMQFARMCIVEGQFVRVWSGEAQRGQHAVDLQYLLDVRISSSFDTDVGQECKV